MECACTWQIAEYPVSVPNVCPTWLTLTQMSQCGWGVVRLWHSSTGNEKSKSRVWFQVYFIFCLLRSDGNFLLATEMLPVQVFLCPLIYFILLYFIVTTEEMRLSCESRLALLHPLVRSVSKNGVFPGAGTFIVDLFSVFK